MPERADPAGPFALQRQLPAPECNYAQVDPSDFSYAGLVNLQADGQPHLTAVGLAVDGTYGVLSMSANDRG